jgi:hypothetical protein
MKIIKKDLCQEVLRVTSEQAQVPQGDIAVTLAREDSRRRIPEKNLVLALLKGFHSTHSESCWKNL